MAIYKGSKNNDVINGSETEDYIYGYGGDDVLDGLGGDDGLYGDDGNDQLYGGSGDDYLDGGAGDDLLQGGAGNDALTGSSGADTYLFAKGDGQDRIYNYDSSGSADTLKFTDFATTDVMTISRGQLFSEDLTLSFANSDSVRISGYFGDGQISQVAFADHVIWTWDDIKYLALQGTEGDDYLVGYAGEDNILSGLGGNDRLIGEDGDDTLSGGTGNDSLTGGNGDNLFLFAKGDGLDRINHGDYDIDGMNTIRFTDVASSEVSQVSRVGYGYYPQLVLNYADNDQLSISSYFTRYTDNYRVEFSDGVVWDGDDILQKTMQGTEGNDILVGFWDRANTLDGLGGNDLISGGTMGDSLQGGAGNDRLNGEDGQDTLQGGGGADSLKGEWGDDVLAGGEGRDLYEFFQGDGKDIIDNYDTNKAADAVKFSYIKVADLQAMEKSGDDLTVKYSDADQITIKHHFQDADHRIDQFRFKDGHLDNVVFGTDGDDSLTGTASNDALVGLAGADSLTGGEGNDIYFLDDVADQTIELDGQGKDTVFSSVSHTLGASLENLILTDTAQEGYGNGLANTLTGNATANVLAGGDGRDLLYGESGDDILMGGNGNDVLWGGGGTDVLDGGAGRDLIYLMDSDTDTVKIHNGGIAKNAYDSVDDFTLGHGTDTVGVDRLDLAGDIVIAADTLGSNGLDVGNITSHAISDGIITFNKAINSEISIKNALGYLQQNLTHGETVAFNVSINDGYEPFSSAYVHSSMYVFQDNGADDSVVELSGVYGASGLSTDGLASAGIWLA